MDEVFERLKSQSEIAYSEHRLQVQNQRQKFEAFIRDLDRAQVNINQISTSTGYLSSTLDAVTGKIENLSYLSVMNQLLRSLSLMPVIFLFSPYVRRGIGIIFTFAAGKAINEHSYRNSDKFSCIVAIFNSFLMDATVNTLRICFTIL